MKQYFVSIRDAAGNEEKRTVLKEKYKAYVYVPFVLSLNNTLQFLSRSR